MTHYQLIISSSDYSNSILQHDEGNILVDDPKKIRGFYHNDIVEYSSTGNLKLITRNLPEYLTGELQLYSKYIFKTNSKSNKVQTYLFRPIDRRYPYFYVNSSTKSKYTKNILINIEIADWSDDIYPRGILKDVIGTIDDLNAMENAMLFNSNIMPKNIKIDRELLKTTFDNLIIDRKHITDDIISIDPAGCKDIDDAFSIRETDETIKFYIHISDVYTVLNSCNIIDNIPNITSIYLKNRILHMLPGIISTDYCSLVKSKCRLMLTLEINYSINNDVFTYDFYSSYGKITNNYSYSNYPKSIEKYWGLVEKIYENLTGNLFKINGDSHRFIEVLMLIYNYYYGNYILKPINKGLIRVQKNTINKTGLNIPNELASFLEIIHTNAAKYANIDAIDNHHDILDLYNYTHTSSPIRRVVDLINQEIYYKKHSVILINNNIDYINEYNRKLKKVYRLMNKIYLAYSLYNNDYGINTRLSCYIYNVNIDRNKLYLYFPDSKLSIVYPIVNRNLVGITNISIDGDILYIQSNEVDRRFELYKLIQVEVNGKPNIFNPDDSLLITFID